MSKIERIAEKIMAIPENDIFDLISGSIDEKNIPLANFIREAVIDSLNYDLGLAPNEFKLHFVPNSELLDILKEQARKEKLTIAIYVREAVIAVSDLLEAERYLPMLSKAALGYKSLGRSRIEDIVDLRLEEAEPSKERALVY